MKLYSATQVFMIVATLLLLLIMVTLVGCTFLLPSKKTHTVSSWDNFKDAQVAYNKVVPGTTTVEELKVIGYDPYTQPNITIENYLKVRNRFDPRHSGAQLPKLVHECLKVLELCIAYVANTGFDHEKRVGNVVLDVAGFHRKTHVKGWVFEAIFIINDKVVVYKLWSGLPQREKFVTDSTPLGPLQSVGSTVVDKINPL